MFRFQIIEIDLSVFTFDSNSSSIDILLSDISISIICPHSIWSQIVCHTVFIPRFSIDIGNRTAQVVVTDGHSLEVLFSLNVLDSLVECLESVHDSESEVGAFFQKLVDLWLASEIVIVVGDSAPTHIFFVNTADVRDFGWGQIVDSSDSAVDFVETLGFHIFGVDLFCWVEMSVSVVLFGENVSPSVWVDLVVSVSVSRSEEGVAFVSWSESLGERVDWVEEAEKFCWESWVVVHVGIMLRWVHVVHG